MLYSFIPPLIFFSSLGGIIYIVSRVVGRMRQAELSENMAKAAVTDSSQFTWRLAPDQKRIRLIGSRLGMLSQPFQRAKAALLSRRRQTEVIAPEAQSKAAETPTQTTSEPVVIKEPRRWRMPNLRKYTGPAIKTVGKGVSRGVTSAGQVAQKISKGIMRKSRHQQLPEPTVTTLPVAPPPAPVSAPVLRLRRALSLPAEPPTVDDKPGSLVSPFVFHKKPQLPSNLQTAEQAIAAEEYKQAESILVPYIVKHTRDATAYMLLGRVAVGRKNWTEAIEIFDQVVALNPKEKDVYALLGLAAYRAGKVTRALQALQRAQEADPENEEILNHLLVIAHQMDNAALQNSIEEKLRHIQEKNRIQA